MNQKETATEFLKNVVSGEVDSAFARWVSPSFIHHNAHSKGDRESLRQAMNENASSFPEKTIEVYQTIEEKDRVVTLSHVCLKPGDKGLSLVHIFRFEGDLIAELWDIGIPVPEEVVNQFGLF